MSEIDPVVEASEETDTDQRCPYCGEEELENKHEHIEDEHLREPVSAD